MPGKPEPDQPGVDPRAACSGVFPQRSLRLASAPWASSASTASGCSWWEAARCNAVRPSPLAMPVSASARSSSRMVATAPISSGAALAKCSGVLPSLSRRLGLPPASSSYPNKLRLVNRLKSMLDRHDQARTAYAERAVDLILGRHSQ